MGSTDSFEGESSILESAELIKESGLWDRDWYLFRNPDVARAGVEPLEHYLRDGFKEGRDPSPYFCASEYAANSPTLDCFATNPLLHFLNLKQDEIRSLCDTTSLGTLPFPSAVVPTSRPYHLRRGILLAGNFCREADREAARWFVDEVFPLVSEKCPGIELHLVGLQLPGWKKFFIRPGVRVWGRVSCLDVLLEECRLALVIDRGANEMTNSLMQSVSHGLPVVTTPIAALRHRLRHGETALIAAGPDEFAREIARLDGSEALWNTLSYGGLRLANEICSRESQPLPPSHPVSDEYFRVNFLIVGAQKSGTTALAHYLSQHPQICMAPQKEVHFFDDPSHLTDREAQEASGLYRKAFPNWTGQPIVGEATPIYLYLPEVPRRVANYNPHMRIVVLLREPVSRAFSHYRHSKRLGHESFPLPAALFLEPLRLLWDRGSRSEDSSERWHSYVSRGRYRLQIQRWLDVFPRRQILFLKQDDLLQNPHETLNRVYDHLYLPTPVDYPEPGNHNTFPSQGEPPRWLQSRLRGHFANEVRSLEKLLDLDLTTWRQPKENRP